MFLFEVKFKYPYSHFNYVPPKRVYCIAKNKDDALAICNDPKAKEVDVKSLVNQKKIISSENGNLADNTQQTQPKISQLLRNFNRERGVLPSDKDFFDCIVEYVEKHSGGA